MVIAGCTLTTSVAATADDNATYGIVFTVTPRPGDLGANVELALEQKGQQLHEMSMRMPPDRFRDIQGDGEVTVDGNRVAWRPPQNGGKLSWFVTLQHHRNGKTYDAYINDDWALFRASDIIPPARTRTLKGAVSETSIIFNLPRGWSSATEYPGHNDRYAVDNPARRYSRPTGWVLLGNIGTRIETIAGIKVKVTAPTGHSVRRMDMLALMNWTLPHVARLLPSPPQQLTIFSAAKPMWRGGLSAPRSLYVHADLPLISENGTSNLMHEVMHVTTGLIANDGADWIVEGLAEYYSVELLRRSRTISNARFRKVITDLRDWGKEATALCDGPSTGTVTARAVGVMVDLDAEIKSKSGGRRGLDQVVQQLVSADSKVTIDLLRQTVEEVHNGPAKVLSPQRLPGCD